MNRPALSKQLDEHAARDLAEAVKSCIEPLPPSVVVNLVPRIEARREGAFLRDLAEKRLAARGYYHTQSECEAFVDGFVEGYLETKARFSAVFASPHAAGLSELAVYLASETTLATVEMHRILALSNGVREDAR